MCDGASVLTGLNDGAATAKGAIARPIGPPATVRNALRDVHGTSNFRFCIEPVHSAYIFGYRAANRPCVSHHQKYESNSKLFVRLLVRGYRIDGAFLPKMRWVGQVRRPFDHPTTPIGCADGGSATHAPSTAAGLLRAIAV